jgi:NADH-ubiquinone oxidoreductase chain 2
LLSLIIGTVVGLVQQRIKRLLAYSTISHVGFILLALTINSIESVQAFIFYLMQYSISNLNIFFILITIGYSLIYYVNDVNDYKLLDKKNSPIQLIIQLKGYFHLNPLLALSLAITIFSFIGVPPLIGFFAKQMVLSAALQSGYIFLALIGILTSVIGAVYYLGIIKVVFFDKSDYIVHKNFDYSIPEINEITLVKKPTINPTPLHVKNIAIPSDSLTYLVLSSSLTATISVLTLIILLFIISPQQ